MSFEQRLLQSRPGDTGPVKKAGVSDREMVGNVSNTKYCNMRYRSLSIDTLYTPQGSTVPRSGITLASSNLGEIPSVFSSSPMIVPVELVATNRLVEELGD